MPNRAHEVVIPSVSRVTSPALSSDPERDADVQEEAQASPVAPSDIPKEDLRKMEGNVLRGLLAAGDDLARETVSIEVERHGVVYFTFKIRPLTEREVERLRDKCTSYRRDPRTGLRLPEDIDTSKYRSLMIYSATIEDDKAMLWNNKTVMDRFGALEAWEVIDEVLKPGEKDKIFNKLNELSGYGGDQEEERKSTD